MTEHDSGIANSFTDLMTSLAVIFILLLCATLNNVFEEGQNTRTKILEKLQVQLKEYKGVLVNLDPKDPLALLILVPEGLLEFQLNKAVIPSRGIEFLDSFVPKLTQTIYHPEFRDDVSSVVVEGHTDSSGNDADNLKLSQDRSMAVVNKCISILEPGSSMNSSHEKREHFLRVLSASGRGKQDPIPDTDGNENMSKSRRVVFKIRIKAIEEKNGNLISKGDNNVQIISFYAR
ncbi:MAG: OmpA family protein [Desulfuromonadales bacterium]